MKNSKIHLIIISIIFIIGCNNYNDSNNKLRTDVDLNCFLLKRKRLENSNLIKMKYQFVFNNRSKYAISLREENGSIIPISIGHEFIYEDTLRHETLELDNYAMNHNYKIDPNTSDTFEYEMKYPMIFSNLDFTFYYFIDNQSYKIHSHCNELETLMD